jgi:hypothetical protein
MCYVFYMKKKPYISVGVFLSIIAIAAGIGYYFDPAAIQNVFGIGSAQIDAISDADISAIDAASSSFSEPNPGNDTPSAPSDAPVAVPSTKKMAEKKNITPGSAAAPEQTDAAPEMAPVLDDGSSDVATTGTSLSLLEATSSCSFPVGAPSTTKEVIFNEIAWMGSPSSSNAEWMELKNISSSTVVLSGWELADASGKIKKSLTGSDALAPGALLMLSRGSAGSVSGNNSSTDVKTYSGDLTNVGDVLALMDARCGVSDYLDASNGWPGGDNATKATLERDADGVGWHTSAASGGTPDAENSAGLPPAEYTLDVAFEGDAAGANIASDPAGLVCGTRCTGNFASGTRMTLTPSAGTGTAFVGWSGSCYGEAECTFVIGSNTSLTAQFRSAFAVSSSGTDPDSGVGEDADVSSTFMGITTSSASTTDGGMPEDTDGLGVASASIANHILIVAVQIAGVSSSNDLVKMYNPTASAIDMSGWKLHKKSQTGSDYSLKEFPAGSVVGAGQSFTWANSAGGFSETVGANVSSTETLAADNSVALMDATGNIIDAVAWGTGTGQYGEGPPYPTDPGANQLLLRRSSGGVMADTDNNTNDFIIQ